MNRNRLLRSLIFVGVLLLLVVGGVGIQFAVFKRQQTFNGRRYAGWTP